MSKSKDGEIHVVAKDGAVRISFGGISPTLLDMLSLLIGDVARTLSVSPEALLATLRETVAFFRHKSLPRVRP